MEGDARRRQWFPLASDFMLGSLSTRLQEEFGPTGPLVWVAFLAACKRHRLQGRIEYASDVEAWQVLGFTEPVDNFDLDGFWRRLGQLKKARRTRRGRITNIICTRWDEWNDPQRRRPRDSRNPRSGATITTRTLPKRRPNTGEIQASDSDSESDSDITVGNAVRMAEEEVRFRVEERGEGHNVEGLTKTIAACYAGQCGGPPGCRSPVHGVEAMNWHRGRREDEKQETRAKRRRPT